VKCPVKHPKGLVRGGGIPAVALLLFLAAGCSTRLETARRWMESTPQRATMDFTGRWAPDSTGCGWVPTWDPMLVIQNGTRVKGFFGEYELLGVVKTNRLVVFGVLDGRVHYTWHLEYEDKLRALLGKQCAGYQPEEGHSCTRILLDKRIPAPS